ncbi:alanine racemase [Candidatus Saccharibacteria bacterium]|nr:alanine racemase [Candidatus Saccharibacteria bacterium]
MFRHRLATLNTVLLKQEALWRNLRVFEEIASGKQVVPVLKSNAYGHGIQEIAGMLDGKVGMVAVDSYYEATLVLPVFGGRILVLGYIPRENDPWLKRGRIEYVVQTVRDLRAMARTGKKFGVHMEINTGMNRMGIRLDEVDEYLDYLEKHPRLVLNGVMTHLSGADEVEKAGTIRQLEEFDAVCEKVLDRGFRPEFMHASATAGAVKDGSRYTNAVRLGVGLYGVNPLSKDDEYYGELEGLEPVMSFRSKIIKIQMVKRGERVSYNGTWEARRDSRVAVLPVGYYEGVPRELSGRGFVRVGAGGAAKDEPLQRAPVVGRVCMNHTMVDVTDVLDVKEGTEVTVPVLEWAEEFGISPYELLVRVNSTIRREII